MAKAGVISIDINAGTAKFIQDLEEVKGGIRSVGAQASSTFNTRYAMMGLKDVAEGRYTFAAAELVNELTRVKGALLGIGLGAVGVAAIGTIIYEIHNHLKEMPEAIAKIDAAFRPLNSSLEMTNDALAVSNARLDNANAKLEGKRENTLKLALLEAKEEADKLFDSLEKDIKALNELLNKNATSLKNRLLGDASDADLRKILGGDTGFGGASMELDKAIDKANKAMALAVKNNDQKGLEAARTNGVAAANVVLAKAMTDVNAELKKHQELLAANKGHVAFDLILPTVSVAPGGQTNVNGGRMVHNEQGLIEEAERARMALEKVQAHVPLMLDQSDLMGKNAVLRGNKDAEAAAKAAAEAQLRAWQDALEKKKLAGDVSAAQELLYWNQILATDRSQGEARLIIVDAIDRKLLEAKQKIRLEQKRIDDLAFKEWEDGIKEAQEAATEAGGHPAALRLKTLREADPDSSDERIQKQIPEAQRAADRESTEELKKSLKEQDEAWGLSGQHTAEEVKKRAQAAIDYLEWVRPFYVGIDSLIDEEIKKVIESTKKIYEEADKLAKIQIESKEQTDVGANTAKKLAIEQQYAQYRSHSIQEELANRKELGALEASDLQIKLVAAEIAHEEAMDEGDAVKIAKTRLEIDNARRAIQQQQLQLAIQITTIESEHNKTLKQGLDAFIHDANAQMKEPGDILKDGLTSALDQTSDNLTRTMTGQKTKWADEFKSIGRQMLKESIKSSMQEGLSKLQGHFGIPSTKKPLGTPNDPVNVRDVDRQKQNGAPGAGLGGVSNPIGGRGVFGGSQGGGIFSLLGGGGGGSSAAAFESVDSSISFPALAGGGDVDPGSAYWVGDGGDGSGRELFSPKTAGTVTPASRVGGGGDTYHIDNRGAELGSENRLRSVLQSVHASAVSSAVKATSEQSRRMPRNRK